MLSKITVETGSLPALSGDLEPLLKQVGDDAEWASLTLAAASLRRPQVDSLPALRHQLQQYLVRLLLPIELPAIYQACQFTQQEATRELIALDQSLWNQPELTAFAPASQCVGRTHLRRLRPLRDHRVVQRYGQAVELGQARAWHTLVYGVILSIYSIPHRQGLLNYAQLTLRGFIRTAAHPLQLTEADEQQLLAELLSQVPSALTQLASAQQSGLVCL